MSQKPLRANEPAIGPISMRFSREKILWTGLVLLIAWFSLFNLPYAPHTWFDEGSHLHVPKALVQLGVYADVSSEGFRYHGPTIGVGPTVMLPIALNFQIFGIGMWQGRIIIVLYLLLACWAIYKLGAQLYGKHIAFLSLVLLLASRTLSYEGAIEYGRQVLGEIPGTAFLIFGIFCWLKAIEQPTKRWLIGSGLGFGLALVTKNQFTLIVPPTLILIALLDWQYYRAGTWRLRLIPMFIAGFCAVGWIVAQFQFLTPGGFLQSMQEEGSAASGSILVLDWNASLRAAQYMLRPDLYGGLLIPSLLYGLWQARQRSAHGLAQALLVLLVGLWLSWFLVSLGWPRYAFPAIAVSAVLVAKAIHDGIAWLKQHTAQPIHWLAYAYLLALILIPLSQSARVILKPDDSAQQFANYLTQTVPLDAIVETWEPELGFLSDHRYHYPPENLLDHAIEREWRSGQGYNYDGLQDSPKYVALGPFGNYTGIYPEARLRSEYTLTYEQGPYVLFVRNNP